MNKVIPLNDKLKLSAVHKAAVLRRKKIHAVRKMFQCSQCASKCERCGTSIDTRPQPHPDLPRIPYHFCASCSDEYLDYIQQLQGKGDPEAYWHNHHWLKAWQTWIEYQGVIDQYLRSKEFRRLIDELGSESHPCD